MTPLLADDAYKGGRKRIFIGLFCVACVILGLLFLVFLILPWLGENTSWLRYASLFTGCLGITVLAWLCLTLVFHIYSGRGLPGISHIRHLMIRLLLPLMEIAGKFAGIDKKIVRRSFIKVNNEFVVSGYKKVKPEKILLLLPHCIQFGACPRRLLFSLDNCAHCGKCQVGKLLDLSKRHGFQIAIATGGTVARRIVVECRPSYIVAVACERDLSSGIQDSYPIPVYGILNERPNGPCRDTIAPWDAIEKALSLFLEKRDPLAMPEQSGAEAGKEG